MGGDVTGKSLVPIVATDRGTWCAKLHGQEIVAETPEALEDLRSSIRTIGRYDVVVSPDEAQTLAEDAAALAAAFDTAIRTTLERWIGLAEARLARSGVPAFMMLGNDDEPGLAELFRGTDHLRYGEDGIAELPGGWQLVSFGPSTPTPWLTPRELPEEDIASALAEMVAEIAHPERAIFNIHCPPANTRLDQAPLVDGDLRPRMNAAGPVIGSVGSSAVREAIERAQPALGLHGHVHESPGMTKIGSTVCLNPGSDYQLGILRGAIVELDAQEGVRSWQFIHG